MRRLKILLVFGTRPEAIKLCPVLRQLRSETSRFEVRICVTAQHRDMLDQALQAFGVTPDYDLDIMAPGQTLCQSTSRIVGSLEAVLDDAAPDMVLVQGDTTTTLCGAMAAFYKGIPVGHVEAGLRTGDLRQPFPEEMNRVLTTRVSVLHFAATEWARDNLLREGVCPANAIVCGNTGIDAVLYVRDRLEDGSFTAPPWDFLDQGRKLILVTAHRRESFGAAFQSICDALVELSRRDDVQIVYPVHPNPNVRDTVSRRLGGNPRIHLLPPLEYIPFVDLMRRAYILVTDSGGIQEEGPSLGKPILVLREKTERPEAVEAGTVRLVGADPAVIVKETSLLLDNHEEYVRRCRIYNPYGDGRAAERIVAAIGNWFER